MAIINKDLIIKSALLLILQKDTIKDKRIFAHISADNISSIKTAVKQGFVKTILKKLKKFQISATILKLISSVKCKRNISQ